MKKACTECNRSGFTLVEILVVLAVLSLVGVLVVTIFTRTLRGANKSQILSSIKQNGQASLENMDKTIRGAHNLVCISSDNNIIVVERDGIYTRYRFDLDLTGKTNGAVRMDRPIQAPQERVCNPADPMVDFTTLSDTNTQTGVKVVSGSFKRGTPQAGFKDIVTILFALGPGVEAPKAVAGQIDPVTFQTTILIR